MYFVVNFLSQDNVCLFVFVQLEEILNHVCGKNQVQVGKASQD